MNPPIVAFIGLHLEAKESMKPILEEFSKKIRMNIRCQNLHGYGAVRMHDGDIFYVYFWPPGKGEYNFCRYTQIFDCTLTVSQTSGVSLENIGGIPLFDNDDILYGKINNNVLYIGFDLPHMDNEAVSKAFPLMLEKAYYYIENRNKAINEKDAIAAAKFYFPFAKMAAFDLREEWKEQINRLCNQVADLQRQLKTVKEINEKEMAKEFTQISSIDGVKEVSFSNNGVTIITEPITLSYNDRMRKFGSFKIYLPFSSRFSDISIKQMKDAKWTFPHLAPPLRRKGADNEDVCFGSLSLPIAKLLGEGRFSTLTGIIIKFLHSPMVHGYTQYCRPIRRPNEA